MIFPNSDSLIFKNLHHTNLSSIYVLLQSTISCQLSPKVLLIVNYLNKPIIAIKNKPTKKQPEPAVNRFCFGALFSIEAIGEPWG